MKAMISGEWGNNATSRNNNRVITNSATVALPLRRR